MLQIKSKKLLLGICFFVLLSSNSFGQVAGDFRSVATGTWSAIATWQTFNGASWVAAVAAPTAASGTITIQSPNVVSISAGLANSATIVINAGGTLRTLAAIVFTNNAGGIVTNNGIIVNSFTLATGSIINNGVINNNLTFTNNGILTNNLTINNALGATITQAGTGAFTNAAAGTITNTGTLTVNAARAITNNGTFTNTGTFTTFSTSTTTNSSTGTFTHNSATAITSSGTFTNSGILTISASRTFNNNSAFFTNSLTGKIKNFGTFVNLNLATPANKIMNYGLIHNNTGATINNASQLSQAFRNYSGAFIINSGTVTPGAIIDYFHMDNGSKYQHWFSTSVVATTLPALTWNAGSTCEIRGCGSTNLCPIGASVGAGVFSDFIWADTTQSALISLQGRLTSVRNLTIRHTNTQTLKLKTNETGGLIISGNLNIETNAVAIFTTGGAGFAGSGITIDLTGNYNQTGGTCTFTTSPSTTAAGAGCATLNVGGSFNLSSGTLNLNASNGTSTASTQANGTINLTSVSSSFNVSGGTLNLNSSTITGGGGLGTINLNGACNFVHTGGTISKTAAAAGNTGTINIIGTSLQTIESTSGFAANTIAFNISQTTSSGLCQILATKTFTVNSSTTLNINNNTSIGLATNPELTVLGNIAVNGTGIINVNALAKLDMRTAAMTGTGTFNLATTATLITQHAGGISNTAATGCIQNTTKSFHANANYYYNGTVAQVTGNALPTPLTDTLTINNTSTITTSGVTLSQLTTITGNLQLINGRFITSSFLLTIGNGGTSSIGSATSFVDGPIKKIGNTLFTFPTGDLYNVIPAVGFVTTAKWAPIEIAAPGLVSDEYIAEYHKLDDPCNVNYAVSNNIDVALNHVSYKEYWDLNRNVGATSPHVKLYWPDGSESTSIGSAISSPIAADLHVAEYYNPGAGLKWYDKGTNITAGSTIVSGSIATSIAPTFITGTSMQFTFGAPTAVNPLPVELLVFEGLSTDSGNQLFWSTATETNNDYFNLERSIDGFEFASIAKINGNGNSTSTKNYEYLDVNRFNEINYYRLKQVDFDGNYSYSNIVSIKNDSDESTIQIFPNPCQDVVNIVTSDNFSAVTIYNVLGELAFSSATSQNTIQFNPLADGLYVVKATTKNGKEVTARFIKN